MTTIYYDEYLPLNDKRKRTPKSKKRHVEILESDFYGTHELYLRVDDDEHATIRLDEKQAKDLLESLQMAMRYLGYLPPTVAGEWVLKGCPKQ